MISRPCSKIPTPILFHSSSPRIPSASKRLRTCSAKRCKSLITQAKSRALQCARLQPRQSQQILRGRAAASHPDIETLTPSAVSVRFVQSTQTIQPWTLLISRQGIGRLPSSHRKNLLTQRTFEDLGVSNNEKRVFSRLHYKPDPIVVGERELRHVSTPLFRIPPYRKCGASNAGIAITESTAKRSCNATQNCPSANLSKPSRARPRRT